jgi:hypothetical protein
MSEARPQLPEQDEILPAFRVELCAMHGLWMTTPLSIELPLSCHDTIDQRENYLAWRYLYEPPWTLAQMPLATLEMVFADFTVSGGSVHPAKTVALATVMAYAAATYGPERIPLLVDEAGRQESWATLIPAVFGVSADEFETGWQAYLVEHYAITPPTTAD